MADPRPVSVVVVSPDVSVLHEISWILDAVGYQVETSTDLDQDALWRRYSLPDVLIIDGRGVPDPTPAVLGHESENPLYRIFLYDPSQPADFSAWYAAGAEDALRVPVSRGEVLTRIRTGARYLEFERRLQVQSTRSMVSGLLSRRGLLRKLRKLAGGDESGPSLHSLLVCAIDWFAGIARKNGETASRGLLNTASRAIKRAVGDNAVSAYLGDGRFATLLVGQPVASAKLVAEALAKDFGSRESHHESIPRPTLTCAVVPWPQDASPDRFLGDALETLRLAEHSGGDRVMQHGELNQQFAEWNQEMTSGNPFAGVVAQDIMEPFAVLLSRDAEPARQAELAAALRRSGVPVRPYVNREGRLVGMAADETPVDDTGLRQVGGPHGDALVMPETIPHDATFPEIYEAFSSRGCATLVVTAGDHPLGYLTCDGFLSLIDPIDAETFAAADGSQESLAGLVVPSFIGEPAAV